MFCARSPRCPSHRPRVFFLTFSGKFEVAPPWRNLRVLLRYSRQCPGGVFGALACDDHDHIDDSSPGWVFICLPDLLHMPAKERGQIRVHLSARGLGHYAAVRTDTHLQNDTMHANGTQRFLLPRATSKTPAATFQKPRRPAPASQHRNRGNPKVSPSWSDFQILSYVLTFRSRGA